MAESILQFHLQFSSTARSTGTVPQIENTAWGRQDAIDGKPLRIAYDEVHNVN